MAFRIEITFSGDAPEDELARAKILGSEAVQQKIDFLKQELAGAGLETSVVAHTIRTQEGRRKPRLAEPQVSRVAAE